MVEIRKKLALRCLDWAGARRERRWARALASRFAGGMPLSILPRIACAWKSAGFFEAATLRLLESVVRRRGLPGDVLELCEFRRNIGSSLNKNDLENLRCAMDGLSEVRREWVRRVEREIGGGLMEEWPFGDDLGATVWRSQLKWRYMFEEKVRTAAAAGGICVVGNSAVLCGKRLGEMLDAGTMVVRFNLCKGAPDEDLGSKLDVWMGSPGFDGPVPLPRDFLILSGNETHWILKDWSRFYLVAKAGVPILTVPRVLWKEAVEAVKAPPSAGFLLLGWLRRILGGWNGVAVAGIGTQGARYHQAGPQYPPACHHNFEAEAREVARFVRQGLVRIG